MLRYGLVIAGLLVFGVSVARLRAPPSVQANEGMVLIALMFLFTPLVMAYPMMGFGLSFLDAFFEAVSGVTTTGLSTQASLAGASSTFLVSRAWMQWYGGLGIVVLALALVMRPGLLAKGLAVNEAEAADLVGGIEGPHAAHPKRCTRTLTACRDRWFVVGWGSDCSMRWCTHSRPSRRAVLLRMPSSLAVFGWPAQAWITLTCLAGSNPADALSPNALGRRGVWQWTCWNR